MGVTRLTEERRAYWRALLEERHDRWHYLTEKEQAARAAEKERREDAAEDIEEALGALNEAGEVLKTGFEPAEQLSLLSPTAPRELTVLPPVEEPPAVGCSGPAMAATDAALSYQPARYASPPARKRGRPSKAALAEREERVIAWHAKWPADFPPSLADLADDAEVSEEQARRVVEAHGLAIWTAPCATTDAENAVLASHKKLASDGDPPELAELARHADTGEGRTLEIVRAFRLEVVGVPFPEPESAA